MVFNVYAQKDVNIEEFLNTLKLSLNQVKTEVQQNPDAGLNISQYLEKYNYPLESHEVLTEDGFIITLHRIPHGSKEKESGKPKPAVLLAHGLLCSSMDWVYLGPNKSLALILADIGYDIWLFNARGTRFSMKHKSLNSSEAAFWDYSWHEKGYYDLAASVDYIISRTNLQNVTVVGHSEGTTDTMVLTSTRPKYNDKINLAVLLSPIGFMKDLRSPLVLLMVKYMDVLKVLVNAINFHGIPYNPLINDIALVVCGDGSPFQDVCANFVGLLCGYDSPQLDKSFLSVLVSNTPAGISVKELLHYGQEIKSGYFRQYDYGLANVLHYGKRDPPSYDLSKITVPVAAYYSENDFFAATKDVEKLMEQLPNKVDQYLIEYKLFNHLDFITAIDVTKLLYNRVVSVIQKYNPLEN